MRIDAKISLRAARASPDGRQSRRRPRPARRRREHAPMTSVEETVARPVEIAPVARLWPQLRFVVDTASARRLRRRHHGDFRVCGGVRRFPHPLRPGEHERRALAGAAGRGAPLRRRFHGAGRLQPHHLWGPHLARGRARLDGARLRARRRAGARLRLSGRLGRPRGSAAGRRHAGAAAAGARPGHGGRARTRRSATRSWRSRSRSFPMRRASSAPTRWRCARCPSSRPRARSA